MMRRSISIVLILTLLMVGLISGCSNTPSTFTLYEVDKNGKTLDPILTGKDIIMYDWDNQAFTIPKDLIEKRLGDKFTDEGVLFEAYINNDKIYEGRLVSYSKISLSSKILKFDDEILLGIYFSNESKMMGIPSKPLLIKPSQDQEVCQFEWKSKDTAVDENKIKNKRIYEVFRNNEKLIQKK